MFLEYSLLAMTIVLEWANCSGDIDKIRNTE